MARQIMLISLILLLFGILLTGLAIRQLVLKRKILAASVNGLLGVVVLLVASFVSMLFLSVQSYVQLTKEQLLAEVEVGAVVSGNSELVLTINGERRVYPISAGEWRVDARFIKWKPWVALLGKEPVVRLESLSGREAGTGSRVIQVHNLHDDFAIVDRIVANLTDRFGMVDTMYGSSVYMPVERGARYRVSANHAGLIARPVNDEGKQAIIQWDR
ncbi:MAG: hypothetical protein KME65_09280 [Candidatus Thiodiazotropha sp. (ex Ctena orbiculata)]|uniref:Uncharacterized protein n=1 Tax=Candidatus Thiodiazotropha taylori TaxID=2792791 RepID=A0A944M8G1_9GAMM|nr:hypothetical protein [Candidatus Thiodiazotropha taylori]